METLTSVYEYLGKNKEEIIAAVVGFWTFVEIVVRLTPTKTDDTALERIGHYVHKLMDFLKIPNVIKRPEAAKEIKE